ncbi:MAG TPA: Stk1 family PASTA domain-containing Ser/Thr kinase [Actinomycetota bacterium]|nr:Stk1 family PASTA domain-containing Ser/Thr kinase [Actinomycetota bacterium]
MIETTVDGRYQIVARIASGGMGEVYRAHDAVLDRDVALKILHTTLAGDDAFIDRFRREARAAGLLGHPNIVAVHDWGETGDTYFMVMEFVHGPNLRSLLLRHGPLQSAQAVEVGSQVLAALEHAHGKGIIHRDVKPENILITTDGVAKVADFGLARALAESRVTSAPGTVTGTVQYLAPEQIEGEPADARTDLYATGIVLYELLVGRVPFTGETSVAIAYKHLRDRVPSPSMANPMVPPSLDRAVLSATEPDRSRRTPDAATMRRELAAAVHELPPAEPLASVAATVPPADEGPADRAATVTIPRALSPRAKRRKLLRQTFRVAALVVALAAGGWATWTYAIPHITVPDLGGKTVDAATAEAEAADLELSVGRQVFSGTVSPGAIVTQDPAAADRVRRGTEISVVVSRGPELVAVPGVRRLPEEEAKGLLEEANLQWEVQRDYHLRIAEGRVIDQNPAAGNTIEAGKIVVITVSQGKPPVSVPEVVGRSETDAGALLRAAGLGVSVVQEFSLDVPRGTVIRQKPGPNKIVTKDSIVTIVVSKGPQQFPMPEVVGKSSDAARADLQGLDLVVSEIQLPGSSGSSVVGQQPKAGTIVESGQEVTIYIGGG